MLINARGEPMIRLAMDVGASGSCAFDGGDQKGIAKFGHKDAPEKARLSRGKSRAN